MKINIKPLSINDAFLGRRFKSNKYKMYEFELWYKLPDLKIPKGIKLELKINVGFSSKGSDLDNICKPFQDVISKKYKFNDNQIYRLVMNKEIVKKGSEFIYFELSEY
ncbi:resolvase [Rhodobacteraceae phage LS06-2018-MD05]|nr:resolvase [Rhodobacteraceae phage LS06-2018-MD05]